MRLFSLWVELRSARNMPIHANIVGPPPSATRISASGAGCAPDVGAIEAMARREGGNTQSNGTVGWKRGSTRRLARHAQPSRLDAPDLLHCGFHSSQVATIEAPR